MSERHIGLRILKSKLEEIKNNSEKLNKYLRLHSDDQKVVEISNNLYLDAKICIDTITEMDEKAT